MHDWHLANEIFKTVLEYATKNGLKKVSKVKIELGSVVEHGEEILPENLIYNFKLLAQKTIAKNAEIKIKKITCPPCERMRGRREGDSWKLIEIEGEKV